MKNKKTFRIGELSKLFGVSTDAIRYYEKVGILNPKRNAENNYRYYTLDDVRKILESCSASTSPPIRSGIFNKTAASPKPKKC